MCQRMMSDVLKKDLTPCDYFLWGIVKETVYIPPLPITLDDLWNHLKTTVNSITVDTLARVWDKFGYCIVICRAVDSGHIEHL
ncbi:hypothetical protein C0J52_22868 [Blattella germanica]|nr:hypothetical protein C0J52_22868 [Blattella germanica]